jgi:arsenate reductase (glutaredoxin)
MGRYAKFILHTRVFYTKIMISIYHNPRCSKSRQTLTLLEERGIEPEVVLYLETPPTVEALTIVLKQLGISARQLLRKGEDAYKENNLSDTSLTEQQLIDIMAANPKLIERPIVINGDKAALGRPPEQVLDIL